MSTTLFRRVLIAAALAMIVITSCQHKDYGDQRLAERRENIEQVVEWAAKREKENDRRLADAGEWIRNDIADDARDSAANMEKLGARWRAENERWEARQRPFRDAIGRILRGKPERIERTAISMFY